jgi:hypothetical protein
MVTPLTETDEAVLQHVARYRLTLPRFLAATSLLASRRKATAQAALDKLTEQGWLSKADLCPSVTDGLSYYHLSPQAARQLGHDPLFAEPLKHDMRIECFAIAAFCCCGKSFRQLFTKQEFVEKFKSIWYPGQPVRYYLEPTDSGKARLAFLKVDKDGAGRWDRLIDSCYRFVKQRTFAPKSSALYQPQIEAFAKLVANDQFQITVLTALPEKRRAIQLELERRRAAGEPVPPIDVHVVPGLFEVMFPTPGNQVTCMKKPR